MNKFLIAILLMLSPCSFAMDYLAVNKYIVGIEAPITANTNIADWNGWRIWISDTKNGPASNTFYSYSINVDTIIGKAVYSLALSAQANQYPVTILGDAQKGEFKSIRAGSTEVAP